jgi:hypothetical protein
MLLVFGSSRVGRTIARSVTAAGSFVAAYVWT